MVRVLRATPADTPQQVRLSGHGTDLDGLDAELVGFSLEPVELGPARGLAGRSSDPIGPSVVLMPVTDDVTVMALSYELTTPELVTWSMELAPATEAEWRSANAAAFAASDE